MAKRWTALEESNKRLELTELYLNKNKTIGEIALELGIEESTVYDRLIRLNIPVVKHLKPKYNNIRQDIVIPKHSEKLAEFIGVMLGDGHLSKTQVTICLGNKEKQYSDYLVSLMSKLFGAKPKCTYSREGHCAIYLGSTKLVRWLLEMGLVFNKTISQVDTPPWIKENKEYAKAALKGLFDTDGSIYRLKSNNLQISLRNYSYPLLSSIREMLVRLGFRPSNISSYSVYLTRKDNITKFIAEIGSNNQRHRDRFLGL